MTGTGDQHLENRLEGRIDGALHLLDRQVLDCEGRMAGKVDDVELTEVGDDLGITGVLTGAAALLPRLGGGLGGALTRKWAELRVPEPHRTRPWRIDMSDVDRLDSALHLSVHRDGVLRHDRDGHRLGRLTGMDVLDPAGERIGRVMDVRFEPGPDGTLVLRSVIVGHGRPGSLLGYDRRGDQGPWLVRTVVRRLHRHAAIADVRASDISWADATVRLRERPSEAPQHPFD